MANVWQADHDRPARLKRFDCSFEDVPRVDEMLEHVGRHDAVEAAQGHQDVVTARQVI